MRIPVVVWVLLVAVSACTTLSSETSLPTSSETAVASCREPPEVERVLPASDFTLTVTPNAVTAGAGVDLVIEVTADAPQDVVDTPETDLATGAGARLQCWDGSAWVDTHQLLKNGFGTGGQPAAIPLGPDVTVTIPAVGLLLIDQPYGIVVPDVPPGVYRIEDSLIVGSSQREVYGLIELRTSPVEAFCAHAVPILSRDDLGDDPAAMQRQTDQLSLVAELMPADRLAELQVQIDALEEQLDLAARGQAENGWSNADIIDTVGELCGEDDLIAWTVQP